MAWTEPVGLREVGAVLARLILPIVLATAILAARLVAQGRPISATGSQGLTFGALFPGVAAPVPRTDAARAGRFDVRGARDLQVRFDFSLPAAMTSAGGAALPLVFGPNDGGYAQTATIASAAAFDPRSPLLAFLSANGRLYIWLGGTALPGPQQPSGAYSATITMTMAYTGL